MARSSSASHGQSKDFNAQQAQKRRMAKGKHGTTDIADVYDFAVSQTSKAKGGRAARRAAYQDNAEEQDPTDRKGKGPYHNDDEEDDDDDEEEDDPGPIAPDVFDSDDEINTAINGEDEEIDSDQAFGESDEERFIDFKFSSDAQKLNQKKRTKKAPQRKDVNLEEDETSEQDESEDGDLIDISRMLDSNSEEEEEDDEESMSDDDDDDEDVASKLRSQIDSFTAKRSAESSGDQAAPQAKRTRRVLAEQTLAAQEGEFATSGGAGLRLKDFMAPLSGQIDFADVRKSTKALEKGKSGGTASKKGGGALSAPLPTALQEKLDRQAALKLTKGEVQGWEPTLRRIRDAEQLSFPLQKPEVVKRSTAGMVADFKPSTEMEDAISNMLTEGGMTEKQLAQQEDLAMNHLDPEEIKARRAELRRMRDLMFRVEQKAKRVSKIKSKAYRKVQRKEKERLKEKMKELDIDEDDEEDMEEGDEERMRTERLRAEERATLRHRNTGKWAKGVVGGRHGEETKEARDALEDQLRRGEQLRRRIHGKGSDSESEESSDAGSDEEDQGDVKEQAFDELATLEAKENARREWDEAEMERVGGKKGVYNMKFMKDARERENQKVRGMVDDFKNEMESMGVDSEEGGEAAPAMYVGGNKGRAVYGSGTVQPAAAEEAQQPQQQKREKKSSTSASPVEIGGSATIKKKVDEDASNPWLTAPTETGKVSKKNEILVGKGSNTAVKSANRTSKHKAKGWEAVDAAKRDEELEIDLSARLDEDEPVAITGKGVTAFQQRDLVAQAFVHDDVAAEFAAEKAAIIDSEAPKEMDTTLPGWGAWGGKGARQSGAQRRRKQQIAGLDPSKRKDAKMENVLINERKDKKAEHFTVKDLPHPFTSRAQYEMAMKNPLGPEWNTRIETQRLTAPKVLKKMGKVIKPIERKF